MPKAKVEAHPARARINCFTGLAHGLRACMSISRDAKPSTRCVEECRSHDHAHGHCRSHDHTWALLETVVLCIISSPDPHVVGCVYYVQTCEACHMLDLIYSVLMRDIIVPHMQAAATQLLSAARDGDIATVRRLVTEGHVDVNVTNKVGVSSLSCC